MRRSSNRYPKDEYSSFRIEHSVLCIVIVYFYTRRLRVGTNGYCNLNTYNIVHVYLLYDCQCVFYAKYNNEHCCGRNLYRSVDLRKQTDSQEMTRASCAIRLNFMRENVKTLTITCSSRYARDTFCKYVLLCTW